MKLFNSLEDDDEKPKNRRKSSEVEDDGYSGGIFSRSQRSKLTDGWISQQEIDDALDRHRYSIDNQKNTKYQSLYSFWQSIDCIDHNHESSRRIINKVIEQYSSSDRFYHDLSHLDYLIDQYKVLESLLIPKDERNAFKLAILFHDYIYKGIAKDDEHKSALAFETFARELNIDKKIIERAKVFILATCMQPPLSDKICCLFVDMDRSILAVQPQTYNEYLLGVTKEFCGFYNLTPKQFAQARVEKFVKPTLASGTIFQSDFYKSLEPQARENLQGEIRNVQLSQQPKSEPNP